MRAQSALSLLTRISTGELKPGTSYAWTRENMAPAERASMSPDEEALAWETYRRYAAFVEPRASFNREGKGNNAELRRRRVLMGMFFLIDFRSQDAGVERLFKASVGRVSLRELMTFCGRRMPHFYYEWAFDVLPISAKVFGPDALKHFVQAPDHRRTFVRLDEEKQRILEVRKVMES